MLRRLAVLALALIPVVLGSTDPAGAAWAVSGAGPATSSAVVVPQSATPTASKTTDPATYLPVFVVTWDTTFLPGGRAVTGYQIRRTIYPGTFMARTEVIRGSCLGTTVQGFTNVYVPGSPTAAAQSCTDTEAFAKGDVTYSVTPVLSSWIGPTSSSSAVYR